MNWILAAAYFLNGGVGLMVQPTGGVGMGPPPQTFFIVTESGSQITTESGTELITEPRPVQYYIVTESGTVITTESGSQLTTE